MGSDIKIRDTWLERVGMHMSDFEPGMKLKMLVTSVSAKGKFDKNPIVRGLPSCIISEGDSLRPWLDDTPPTESPPSKPPKVDDSVSNFLTEVWKESCCE